MKQFAIRTFTAAGLFLLLLGFTSPIVVQAQGICVRGSGGYVATSAKFPVHKGDVVTITVKSSKPTDYVIAEIFLEHFHAPLASAIGSVTSTYTVTSNDLAWGFFQDYSSITTTIDWTFSINGGCSSASDGPIFSDGRLNNSDAAERAAVYCNKGGLDIYSIGDPWTLALKVSAHDLDMVPTHPATNTLIKQNAGVSLYRLTTGELQINAPGGEDGKGPYVFIFKDSCPRN